MSGYHDYAEAFMLMRYRDTSGNTELIWNSRDGVTPFIVSSRDGLKMQHVDWKSDVYAPEHVPDVGDRVFINLTPQRAREWSEKWFAQSWDYPDDELRADFRKRNPHRELAIAEHALEVLEQFFPGPDLVVVDAELRERFVMRSPAAKAKARADALKAFK